MVWGGVQVFNFWVYHWGFWASLKPRSLSPEAPDSVWECRLQVLDCMEPATHRGVSRKLGVPYFGGPSNKDPTTSGTILGSPIFVGNSRGVCITFRV